MGLYISHMELQDFTEVLSNLWPENFNCSWIKVLNFFNWLHNEQTLELSIREKGIQLSYSLDEVPSKLFSCFLANEPIWLAHNS
jgi:hypothetical protein